MTKKTIVSISVLFISMASSLAFAERGKDAGEGGKGLKSAIEKVANTADARRGNGNGNGNGNGGGNGNGSGDDHGGGHEDDGHPGHCRGNVSPC